MQRFKSSKDTVVLTDLQLEASGTYRCKLSLKNYLHRMSISWLAKGKWGLVPRTGTHGTTPIECDCKQMSGAR